jgi:hypothetical protein
MTYNNMHTDDGATTGRCDDDAARVIIVYEARVII